MLCARHAPPSEQSGAGDGPLISARRNSMSGVAAPIFGADGNVLAALLIAGPVTRYNRDGQDWRKLAKEFASRASRAIGYSGTGKLDDHPTDDDKL